MLCEKCGTQNEAGQATCTNCGAALTGGEEAPKKKGGAGKIILLLAAVIALCAVVAMSGVLGGGKSSPDEAANYIAKAMLAGDAQKVAGMIPSDGWTFLKDAYGIESKEEFTKQLNEELSSIRELKGQGVQMTCLGVNLWNNELYGWQAEELGQAGIHAAGTCNALVDVLMTYQGESEEGMLKIPLIQIGGKWYLDFSNLNSLDVF